MGDLDAKYLFPSSDALTVKTWSAKTLKEALRDLFLSKMMGASADSIIQTKTDLTKKKGDKITFALRMQQTGLGVTGAGLVEGSEDALVFHDFSVEIQRYKNAIKAGTKLDLQRPAFDLRTEMKDGLKDWVTNRLESLAVTALAASPTTNRYMDKSSNDLSVALIQQSKRMAKLSNPKVREKVIEGNKRYVLLAHPYALKGLKADSEYKNMQLYANIRGNKNPLVSGAEGLVDGVLIHEYDRSNLLLTGNVARCLLLGAQAGVVAWAQYPDWKEKLFDFHEIPGVASLFLGKVAKTVFNSEDFGMITLDVKYTPDT